MCIDAAVDSKEETGVPDNTIEITPEMIRAGIDVLREGLEDTYGMNIFPGLVVRGIITAVMGNRIIFQKESQTIDE